MLWEGAFTGGARESEAGEESGAAAVGSGGGQKWVHSRQDRSGRRKADDSTAADQSPTEEELRVGGTVIATTLGTTIPPQPSFSRKPMTP
mmetsp:Transcript_15811/g.21295  ORF Transcript_15811/g.21295 Transcript_15811/m.21295 type:complete len:90 (+) Transcript_15811:665-934(+)